MKKYTKPYIRLQETTDWSDAPHKVPNHTYLVNQSKEFCYAYVKAGTVEPIFFKAKKPFSTSRRKFKIL